MRQHDDAADDHRAGREHGDRPGAGAPGSESLKPHEQADHAEADRQRRHGARAGCGGGSAADRCSDGYLSVRAITRRWISFVPS